MPEAIDDLQMILLIWSISGKWKSCCWGIKRFTNWKITNPRIALPVRIYTLLHIILFECDCKPLNALHYSPRVSYEHVARSPIPKPKLFWAVIIYWMINQMKITCRFIASLYTDRMRNDVDNLITSYQKICLSMLVSEQNNAKTALESRYCLQGNLLYASQNKNKSFQSNRLLEGVKDMDTLLILVAGSAKFCELVFGFEKATYFCLSLALQF